MSRIQGSGAQHSINVFRVFSKKSSQIKKIQYIPYSALQSSFFRIQPSFVFLQSLNNNKNKSLESRKIAIKLNVTR